MSRLTLRMTMPVTGTVMRLVMTLTGTGKGTGLMMSRMPGLVTRGGRDRQSRWRRDEGGHGHVSRASDLLVIGFGARISCRRTGKTIGRSGIRRTVAVPVVFGAAEGVEEGGDLGLSGGLGLMGLVSATRPVDQTGLFSVLRLVGRAGVVGPIDRTVGWAMGLRLVGN